MGEANRRKLAGYQPSERLFTIGVVASRWDHAPKVVSATALAVFRLHDIKRVATVDVPKGDLVAAICQAFDSGAHITDQSKFCSIVAAYVGKTALFKTAIQEGHNGLWIKLLARGVTARIRPVVAGDARMITEFMEKVRRDDLTPGERMSLVYSDHEGDRHITGGIVVREDGTPMTNGGEALEVSETGRLWGTGKSTHVWERVRTMLH